MSTVHAGELSLDFHPWSHMHRYALGSLVCTHVPWPHRSLDDDAKQSTVRCVQCIPCHPSVQRQLKAKMPHFWTNRNLCGHEQWERIAYLYPPLVFSHTAAFWHPSEVPAKMAHSLTSSSQLTPVQASGHLHWYPPNVFAHWPPFRHGFDEQLSAFKRSISLFTLFSKRRSRRPSAEILCAGMSSRSSMASTRDTSRRVEYGRKPPEFQSVDISRLSSTCIRCSNDGSNDRE